MRYFYKTLLIILVFAVQVNAQKQVNISIPNPKQLAWQQAEMGAVFHYDLHVFDEKKYEQNGLVGNRTNPVPDYQIFNPKKLNTDQWIKAAKDAGDTKKEHMHFLKHGDPNGKYWMPAMSDTPLRGYNGWHEWFWEPGDEKHIFPLEDLMDIYYYSMGHNSTLIVGLTPDPNGLLPKPDVKRLKEWGEEIKRKFGKPIAQTSGTGKQLILKLKQPTLINHIILQEDIKQEERVREYVLDGLVNGEWIQIAVGSCIGQKHIQRITTEVEVEKLRLKIEEAIEKPIISNFSIFNVD